METHIEFWDAHALLAWQVELGATDAICDVPIDRYAIEEVATAQASARSAQSSDAAAQLPEPEPTIDPASEAMVAAQAAGDLDALRDALEAFEHCALKRGARNLVFADGIPEARVMVIGEAPGREEDRQGKPFVADAGQLLDAMFAAIGLSRAPQTPDAGLYITNALPWRPPENRDPTADEIAMLKPFLIRHIELADPQVIVLMGNWACMALLGRAGISRMRGTWQEVLGRPAMPMTHPAYLLRNPMAKRDAWADLLDIQERLRAKGTSDGSN
ncbi:uracil-DNA glycosylase [Celeribacter arenosi]|uniref:Type-4 uracil-DNA glycosylase n=1 Tax=Celeribacter arenosi TaxID=792649 RepID=A0ABP7K0P7_9RHOB